MTECENADVRDLLPDYVAGMLAVAQHASVEAHLASCADCADETALLRVVRSVRPRAVDIDVARIVAALPRRATAPALQLVRGDGHVTTDAPVFERTASGVVDIGSRRRPSRSIAWRVAAAIGVTVIGSWSVLNVAGSGAGSRGSERVAIGSSTDRPAVSAVALPQGESLATHTVAGDSGPGSARRAPAPAGAGVGLSLGDLSEYSDEELQRVLDRLDKWDGATSTDPVTPLPIVSVSRGTL